MHIPRPRADQCPPHFLAYIQGVTGDDAVAALTSQRQSTAKLLSTVPESRASFRYAPGKWTLREVVGHLSDSERVLAYRLLRFARGDTTPLPGFDENLWVPNGRFERRSLQDVLAELITVRATTLVLVQSLDEPALSARGVAAGHEVSVPALVWSIAGHEAHHLRLLRERYLGEG